MGLENNSFTNQYNRLISTFGDRQLGPDVRERFWHYAQNLPDNAIKEIIDELLDTLKYAPKPVEFKEAALRWKRKNRKVSPPKEKEVQIVKCKYCYDTLYCYVKDPQFGEPAFMICDHKPHQLKTEFPYGAFKPKEGQSLWDVAERWTKAKKVVDGKGS